MGRWSSWAPCLLLSTSLSCIMSKIIKWMCRREVREQSTCGSQQAVQSCDVTRFSQAVPVWCVLYVARHRQEETRSPADCRRTGSGGVRLVSVWLRGGARGTQNWQGAGALLRHPAWTASHCCQPVYSRSVTIGLCSIVRVALFICDYSYFFTLPVVFLIFLLFAFPYFVYMIFKKILALTATPVTTDDDILLFWFHHFVFHPDCVFSSA